MRDYRSSRPNGTIGTFRPKRTVALASLLLLAGAPPAARASHDAPVIATPIHGSSVGSTVVEIGGTVAGDAVLVRIFEGATALADVGPVRGYWSVGVPFADGPHAVTARAQDLLGAWSAPSPARPFTVDTLVPAAPAIHAPDDGSVLPFDEVTVEGTAEPGARVTVRLSTGGDRTVTADGTGVWRFTRRFEDAPHTLTARATDAAGNASLPSAPVTFRVDTIAPSAPHLFTPGDGTVVRPPSIHVSGLAEPGAQVTVHEGAPLGSAIAASDGTWSVDLSLGEGTHALTARAVDLAGHVSPPSAPMRFRVDRTAPAIPIIDAPAQDAVVPMSVVVSGRADPGVTVQLLGNLTVLAEVRADRLGGWRIEMSWFTGPQRVRARAVDDAGNRSGLSPERSFTIDADPPTVSIETGNPAIFLPANPSMIEGAARDGIGVAAIELHYFDVVGRWVMTRYAMCEQCPAPGNVSWTATHALAPGSYTVKAWAIDRAGNRSIQPAQLTYLDL